MTGSIDVSIKKRSLMPVTMKTVTKPSRLRQSYPGMLSVTLERSLTSVISAKRLL
jgi:hypothetical protein